ncbi:hypothetical protein [Neorhodopirellula pilleata]|uniref:Peptidase family M50 n=1 Tax=Neorhodopirellula pilleata TaxID=2714738 RepID=A0A5C5ZLU7_9BACT|nr:hypothetical protein [Neorhodopirellula pilleata]TWT87957.1 hypothetical protein Pla100_58090 [Neorhodopirellula pilleata]
MRLADGLIVREIELVDRNVWVVKEPRSDQFFFFEQHEWSLLKSLPDLGRLVEGQTHDGNRDQTEPFFAHAAKQGLIVGHPQSIQPVSERRRGMALSNPLAIRVPGFDPSQSLDRILRYRNWFQYRVGFAMVVVSVLLVLFHLDAFVADVSRATYQLGVVSGSTWLTFLFAVAIIKIVHELAHGLACHSLGGRCREMGLMFLFGVPCLYCDVSDAWLIRDRWSRIAVSAAGMIAEWIVASIAVLVWVSTHSGWVHDLAAMLVIVASVSTLIVNANPLLRYDGYFILSDWWGVPNLSAEASAALREWAIDREPWRPRWGLVVYAILSGLYRFFVIGVLLWVIGRWITAWIGVGAALPVAIWIGWLMLRRWFSIGTELVTRRMRAIAFAGLSVFVLALPFPQTFRGGGIVKAMDERNVYSPATGTIQSSNDHTEQTDWSLEMDLLKARGLVEELTIGLRSLELSRFDQPSISSTLPTLRKRLESAKAREAVLSRQADRLRTTWSQSERLFEPTRKESFHGFDTTHRSTWVDLPLDKFNDNAVIERGTLLGRVGDHRRRVVSVFIPGDQIDLVRLNQTATACLPSLASGSLTGTIVDVSQNPVDELPPELVTAKWILTDPMGQPLTDRGRAPRSTHYEVRVAIDESDDLTNPLPTRMIVPVRLYLSNRSTWERWVEWFRTNVTWAF